MIAICNWLTLTKVAIAQRDSSRSTSYLVATEDYMIPPDAQRFMAKRANAMAVEAAASHSVYISRPEAIVALIETAIKAIS